MAFLGTDFLLFFTVFLAAYWALPRAVRDWVLLAFSLALAAYWDPALAVLLPLSSVVGHLLGRAVHAARGGARSAWLAGGILWNVALILAFRGHAAALPVGLAFLALHSIGYLADIHRGKAAPAGFLALAQHFCFFPRLVAGPLQRFADFEAQLKADRKPAWEDWTRGALLVLRGLVKKAFIADTLAADLVRPIFGAPSEYGHAALALAVVAFAVQLYCDLSGYADLARGTASFLGFRLPENFRYPYLATNPEDFWRRWHITVTEWFAEYVYAPLRARLSGRAGGGAAPMALMAAFALGGLWHGSGWLRPAWALLHGAALVATAPLRRRRAAPGTGVAGKLAGWAATLLLVSILSVLLALPDLASVVEFCRAWSPSHRGAGPALGVVTLLAFALFAADHLYGAFEPRLRPQLVRLPAWTRGLAYALCIALLFLLAPAGETPFLFWSL